MNEKINGLWDKAVTLVEQEPDGDWSLDTIKDKFAELIVAESYNALQPMLRDMISRGHAYDLIKQHFGVE
jgi:hypothetical protein